MDDKTTGGLEGRAGTLPLARANGSGAGLLDIPVFGYGEQSLPLGQGFVWSCCQICLTVRRMTFGDLRRESVVLERENVGGGQNCGEYPKGKKEAR